MIDAQSELERKLDAGEVPSELETEEEFERGSNDFVDGIAAFTVTKTSRKIPSKKHTRGRALLWKINIKG